MSDTSLQYNIELLKARQRELAKTEILHHLPHDCKPPDCIINAAVSARINEDWPIEDCLDMVWNEWNEWAN